jgi:outer membrane lipoprotein-sorting protein
MRKKVIIFSIVILVGLVFWGKLSTVQAISGEKVLSRVEDVMKAGEDMEAVEKMTLIDSEGNREVREIKLYQKGTNKMLMRFLEPADIRGVGVLVLSPEGQSDLIYLYMPAFRRERRIATHAKNKSFMGTDLSYEDMAQMNYDDKYLVKKMIEKKAYYHLTLQPKKEADISYSSVTMKVNKENYIPDEINYFKEDNLTKKMTIPVKEKIGNYWTAIKMIVKSVETGHKTVMEIIDVKYDQGFNDKKFTVRNLRRFR